MLPFIATIFFFFPEGKFKEPEEFTGKRFARWPGVSLGNMNEMMIEG